MSTKTKERNQSGGRGGHGGPPCSGSRPTVDPAGVPLTSGAYIRIHRTAKGYTQAKLAKALGKVPGSVQAWESDASKPKPGDVPRLAKLLGVDPVELSTYIDRTHASVPVA